MFEIDEAASRIKEEVDEEANIIFGSSYDEALVGKIRVSIVATGIGEKAAVKAKAPKAQDYIAESFAEEKVSAPIAPNVEIDSNLEKFSAHDIDEAAEMEEAIDAAEIVSFEEERIEEDAAETVAAPAAAAPAEVRSFEDFDMIEKSSAMGEMPKASALFKAIINKNEDTSANDANTLNNILASDDNVFAAKTTVRVVEEEPELFPDHNPGIFAPKREEPEQLIVDDEEEHTPTLIERVTGFSIARRNRKKMKENERFQEPVSPSFADNDYEDKMNLDIPSFLRRR